MINYSILYLGKGFIQPSGKRVLLYPYLSQVHIKTPRIIEASPGKVFSMILSNRLESFAEENKLIDDTQIGFKKGSRTVDHMFILTTLIDKYVKQKP